MIVRLRAWLLNRRHRRFITQFGRVQTSGHITAADRPSVTDNARAALSEIRSIIEANLVQGDYEAWHEHPDDTLDAIWDALNRAETTTATTEETP